MNMETLHPTWDFLLAPLHFPSLPCLSVFSVRNDDGDEDDGFIYFVLFYVLRVMLNSCSRRGAGCNQLSVTVSFERWHCDVCMATTSYSYAYHIDLYTN